MDGGPSHMCSKFISLSKIVPENRSLLAFVMPFSS